MCSLAFCPTVHLAPTAKLPHFGFHVPQILTHFNSCELCSVITVCCLTLLPCAIVRKLFLARELGWSRTYLLCFFPKGSQCVLHIIQCLKTSASCVLSGFIVVYNRRDVQCQLLYHGWKQRSYSVLLSTFLFLFLFLRRNWIPDFLSLSCF